MLRYSSKTDLYCVLCTEGERGSEKITDFLSFSFGSISDEAKVLLISFSFYSCETFGYVKHCIRGLLQSHSSTDALPVYTEV